MVRNDHRTQTDRKTDEGYDGAAARHERARYFFSGAGRSVTASRIANGFEGLDYDGEPDIGRQVLQPIRQLVEVDGAFIHEASVDLQEDARLIIPGGKGHELEEGALKEVKWRISAALAGARYEISTSRFGDGSTGQFALSSPLSPAAGGSG